MIVPKVLGPSPHLLRKLRLHKCLKRHQYSIHMSTKVPLLTCTLLILGNVNKPFFRFFLFSWHCFYFQNWGDVQTWMCITRGNLYKFPLYCLLTTPNQFAKECYKTHYILRNVMDFTSFNCPNSPVRKVILLFWFSWKIQTYAWGVKGLAQGHMMSHG